MLCRKVGTHFAPSLTPLESEANLVSLGPPNLSGKFVVSRAMRWDI